MKGTAIPSHRDLIVTDYPDFIIGAAPQARRGEPLSAQVIRRMEGRIRQLERELAEERARDRADGISE